MMPSLFDRSQPDPIRTYGPLLDCLPHLGRERAWALLADLQSAFGQRTRAPLGDQERLRPEVARRFEGSALSAEIEFESFFDHHLRWRQRVSLDWMYVLAFGGELASLITFEGTEHADAALAEGAVVFVPFHIGSYMTVLPALASFAAGRDLPLHALMALVLEAGSKHLDQILPEVVMLSPTALLELVRHARRGGATVFFPDVYFGTGAARTPFTLAGADFLTSDGCSMLASRTRATSIPVWVESKGSDGFVCHFGPGIRPPESPGDQAPYLAAVAQGYEEALTGNPWNWAGWSLATPGRRAAVLSGDPHAS